MLGVVQRIQLLIVSSNKSFRVNSKEMITMTFEVQYSSGTWHAHLVSQTAKKEIPEKYLCCFTALSKEYDDFQAW